MVGRRPHLLSVEERNIANGGRPSQEAEIVRGSGRRMRCMRRIPSRNPSLARSHAPATPSENEKIKGATIVGICSASYNRGYLPHPGNHLTPSVELTTWYLVAPPKLKQSGRHGIQTDEKTWEV